MSAAATQIDAIGNTVGGFKVSAQHDFRLADLIASSHIKSGISTQSSWRVARSQAERCNRHFALLTPWENKN
jgi:hypothetical protein